jgi:DegV family protein with EDD domain
MTKIAIITDTDSSLPLDLAKKHDIVQVPILVQFGEESFRDLYEIDDKKLFARIDREGKLPTTAAPSAGQFLEAFKAAFQNGATAVLCLTISSEMSATYASGLQAAELLPGKAIEVMDTRNLGMGQGFMVLAAAQVAAQGGSIQEAIVAAKSVGDRCSLFGALATLKYIAMSGRVGYLTAGIASVLEIKPILSLVNGKLELVERIRTQQKAWARAVELSAEKAAGKKIERMAIMQVNALESARLFEKQLRAALPCPADILITEMPPGLSSHTGAGMVAVVLVTEK